LTRVFTTNISKNKTNTLFSSTILRNFCVCQDSDDEDVEQEIDAQIEQLLSAKRTVRNIDAASAANVIGECSRIFWFPVVQKCTIPYI
jgi:predicted glycoside hydrolase/deacetylase ChbG (UPF0249 family)